jgi:hypothetical protein
MNANDILQLLRVRHNGDVFIPECNANYARIDAWAMKKSWSHPLLTGYEIKVNRSDFLNDKKWTAYLPYCNELYFACPTHLIEVNEVPENCGLLWTSKTGTRLYTKKKAPYRKVTIPETFWRSILFSRVKIISEISNKHGEKEFWKEWLEERELDHRFGYHVSLSIRKRVEEEIEKVQRENRILQNQIETFEEIKKILVELGLEGCSSWKLHRQVSDKVKEFRRGYTDDLIRRGESLQIYLKSFLEEVKRLEQLGKDVDDGSTTQEEDGQGQQLPTTSE